MITLRVGTLFRGEFRENQNPPYNYDDVCKYEGSLYAWAAPLPSTVPVPLPTDLTYWFPLALKGKDGEVVPATGLLSVPTFTGPTSAQPGETVEVSVGGSISLFAAGSGIVIVGYVIEVDGVTHNTDTLSIALQGAAGTVVKCRAKAMDSAGNASNWAYHDIAIYVNTAPNVTGLTVTMPMAKAGVEDTLTVTGVSDAEGGVLTSTIVNPVGITFASLSSTSGIFTFTPSPVLTSYSFSVMVSDSHGANSSLRTFSGTIEHAPDGGLITSTLPTTVIPNVEYPVTFSGATDANGDVLTYEIMEVVGGTKLSNALVKTSGSATTMVVKVRATDSTGLSSSIKLLSHTINHIPDNTFVTSSAPAKVNTGDVIGVSFAGATDANGDAVTYRIKNVVGGVFGKLTSIDGGESVQLSVLGTEQRLTFDVVAVDGSGVEGTVKHFDLEINYPPDSASIVTTLPTKVNTTKTHVFSITGTDSDSDTLSFDIGSAVGVSFDKVTGITASTSVTATVVAASGNISFSVRSKDTNGLYSGWKAFSYPINQYPQGGYLITLTAPALLTPVTANQVSLSGATDVDGDTLTYQVSAIVGATFSKTAGIAASEVFTIAPNTGVTTVTFSVKAKDTYGLLSGQKDFTLTVNQAPDVTYATLNYPATMVKGVAYQVTLSGVTDPNGGVLTYEVVSVSNGTAGTIATSGEFTLTAGLLAQPVAVSFKAIDGYGLTSVTKTLTSTSNVTPPTADITVPAGTSQTVTIPKGIAGTVTVDGNGGGGRAATSSPTEWTWYRATSIGSGTTYWYRGMSPLTLTDPVPNSVLTAYGDYTAYKASQTASLLQYGGVSIDGYVEYLRTAVPATAGLPSTLSGAIAKTFSGAASGVTTAPSSTQQLFSVDPATTHTVTVSAAANGGSVRIRY